MFYLQFITKHESNVIHVYKNKPWSNTSQNNLVPSHQDIPIRFYIPLEASWDVVAMEHTWRSNDKPSWIFVSIAMTQQDVKSRRKYAGTLAPLNTFPIVSCLNLQECGTWTLNHIHHSSTGLLLRGRSQAQFIAECLLFIHRYI